MAGPRPILAAAALVCLAVAADAQDGPLYEVYVSRQLMGTVVQATVLHPDVNQARQALVLAFMEMERVEALVSTHRDSSEISCVNRTAGRAPVRISAETFALLARATAYAERLGGLFDPTIGPVTSRWGFSGDEPVTRPDSAEIRALLRLVDYRQLRLDARDTTAFLPLEGASIDLGGIAKGYAVDRAAAVLRAHGILNFLLDAGGDLYVSGHKSGGVPWKVGIRHPRRPDALIATLEAGDRAVATSGDYERFVLIEGVRYHHLIDPRTGFPARGRQSATVIARTAEEADVLATYAFIAGASSPADDSGGSISVVLVNEDGTVVYDPSLVETYRFELAK